jgi:hypothetical protein
MQYLPQLSKIAWPWVREQASRGDLAQRRYLAPLIPAGIANLRGD